MLDEVVAIARRADISTTIWHLKTAYHENFGKMPEVLRRIQDARAQGIDVAASVYPYTRASNGLVSSFPPWVSEGGIEQMIARFKDLSLANCYFAHDSWGFPSCYGPAMRDLLVLLIHLYIQVDRAPA